MVVVVVVMVVVVWWWYPLINEHARMRSTFAARVRRRAGLTVEKEPCQYIRIGGKREKKQA
eukprot:COSAG04_NODE_615_length_11914_cov_12.688447_5_plen_61_part_00